MAELSLRDAAAPLALLAVAAIGYALVLTGGVPSGYEGTTVLAGLFAVVALAAAGLREWASGLAATGAALGFWFGSTAGMSTADFFYVLEVVSLLAFLASTIYAAGHHAVHRSPA